MDIGRVVRTRVLPRIGLGDPRHARLGFIETYRFPDAMLARFAVEHGEFCDDERAEVFEGLRDFFAIRAADPDRPAGMPSRIVDEAWQTFTAFARDYSEFCERAFGRHLNYAPSEPHGNRDLMQTWRVACAREGIPPGRPVRLPRLFAMDRRLKAPKGNYYALNETDAMTLRRNMEMGPLILFASIFGEGEPWRDTLFADRAAAGAPAAPMDLGNSGGDAGFADIADGGDMGGGDFGGGN